MSESSRFCYPLTLWLLHQIPIRPTPDRLFLSHKPHFPLLSASAQNKPNVDRSFLRQLLAILRITFPSYRSPEVGIVLVHSTFLVLRTVLSVGIAKLDGKIVRALVRNHYSHRSSVSVPTLRSRSVQMAVAFSAASGCGSCLQFPAHTLTLWCWPSNASTLARAHLVSRFGTFKRAFLSVFVRV
jgi:hypothetical protein